MKYIATVDGHDLEIDVERHGEVVVDGVPRAVDLRLADGVSLFSLILDNESHELIVERREGTYYVLIEGDRYAVEVEDARLKQLKAKSGEKHEEHGLATVAAPMPGMVVKTLVTEGDEVAADGGLLILEAMKMENEIRAPRAGIVKALKVAAGATVNVGDVLAIIGDRE
jgi:biotin carboxyl carrier protein